VTSVLRVPMKRRAEGGMGESSFEKRAEAQVEKKRTMVRVVEIIIQVDATSGEMGLKDSVEEAVIKTFGPTNVCGDVGGIAVTGQMRIKKVEFAADGSQKFWVVAKAFVKVASE
jgi:hypothetical protein